MYAGRQFWSLDPRADDVCIEDIAHALSMKCRFTGHCSMFYSVAEHSYLVSHFVPQRYALWGLMHDAAEAYLPDVARPVKDHLPGYREIEKRVQRAITDAFGMHPEEPREVKAIDTRIILDESNKLMPRIPVGWRHVEGLEPVGAQIVGYRPADAEAIFLSRFNALVRHELSVSL